MLGMCAIPSYAQYVPSESEIQIAKLPLPTELREGAGVINWNYVGNLMRYRASTNGMSCNVDDPGDEVVNIRCYNDQFWEVIARSREIGQTVTSWAEQDSIVAVEISAGTLQLPEAPTAGYRILDRESSMISLDGQKSPTARKWQSIHFPFRTADEMGLPTEEELNSDGMQSYVPFVMSSGTWWSHVMIVHESFDD